MMALRTAAAALLALACVPPAAVAQVTIHVSPCGNDAWSGASAVCAAPDGPKRTIQAAVDASISGDVVLIAAGTYTGPGNYDINPAGRNIVLAGDGAKQTVIDLQGSPSSPRRAFAFQSGEGPGMVVRELIITGGYTERGSAMLIINSSPTIHDCVMVANAAHPAESGQGGGAIFIAGGSPTFARCRFEANHVELSPGLSALGGGAVRSENASPRFDECDFVSNTVTGPTQQAWGVGGGGLMALAGGTLELNHCAFIGNESAVDAGGMMLWGTSATLSDCRFEGNTARNCAGYFSFLGGTTILRRSTFISNIATRCCGGLTIHDSFADISESEFIGNQALGEGGGGILLQQFADVRMRDVVLRDNAALEGGGLWAGDTVLVSIDRARFTSNTAASAPGGGRGGGGAVALVRGSIATVSNSVLATNEAERGGGLYASGGSWASLINCTLARNTAQDAGGALMLGPGSPTVRIDNSIAWLNTTVGAPATQQFGIASGLLDVRYSNIQGGSPTGGVGVMNHDPLFVDAAAGNFRLWPASPSIDAGSNALVPPGLPFDLDRNDRITGAGVDMGAYEYVVAPCYPNCDGSTVEPILNIDDFTCFISEFAAAQSLPHAQQIPHYANCDGSTTAPVLNIDDFTCFITAFAAGCP